MDWLASILPPATCATVLLWKILSHAVPNIVTYVVDLKIRHEKWDIINFWKPASRTSWPLFHLLPCVLGLMLERKIMPKKGVDSNYLIDNMSHKIHQQNLFYLKLVLLVQSVSTKVGHQQTTPITNEQYGMTDTTQEQNFVSTTIIVEGLYLVMISKHYFVVAKTWKKCGKEL